MIKQLQEAVAARLPDVLVSQDAILSLWVGEFDPDGKQIILTIEPGVEPSWLHALGEALIAVSNVEGRPTRRDAPTKAEMRAAAESVFAQAHECSYLQDPDEWTNHTRGCNGEDNALFALIDRLPIPEGSA